MVSARVATETTKKSGLRRGPNSKAKQLGSDRAPDKKQKQKPGTSNVRDML